MSLPVLVAIVGFGIGLIVLLVHLSGGSQRVKLGTDAQVAERFRIDFPDSEVARCFESADGFDALLILTDGSLGLVHTVGSKSLTRHYKRDEFATMISVKDEVSLAFDAHEMTLPRITIAFGSPQTRADIMAALGLATLPVSEAA
ncbi:MAG: hypothetical protein JJ920_20930 [Roseitalea sp.]|nr:hypothetical protein [Roseitalea sp.]MBO6723839.1 hypothetical protein [Roseitalea sp.]MBO6745375.1 hypothetical protein [Roseitalea sp.]